MGIIISFCITVYNQSELVKKCLDSIVSYKGNDIEIIISDDCSTENIKLLVEGYHDKRIKYYRNETNLGHDRNIVNALSKAAGKYAFLLRTRDLIISSAIPLLIDLGKVSQASYITGEAVNQLGELKIKYTKECFNQGEDALEANYNLYIHPSGSMYKLSCLDTDELASFLDENNVPKNGFIVHSMIRLLMAVKGDFCLIQEPVWVYVDTESTGDRAVNRSIGGVSVYDPSLVEMRYQYEIKWAKKILKKNEYKKMYYYLTALYLDLVTWGFKLSNNDKKSQYHYDYERVDFSVSKERKNFRSLCESYYDEDLEDERDKYYKKINKLFMRNQTLGALKYAVRAITYGTTAYNTMARAYKKYFKGL